MGFLFREILAKFIWFFNEDMLFFREINLVTDLCIFLLFYFWNIQILHLISRKLYWYVHFNCVHNWALIWFYRMDFNFLNFLILKFILIVRNFDSFLKFADLNLSHAHLMISSKTKKYFENFKLMKTWY